MPLPPPSPDFGSQDDTRRSTLPPPPVGRPPREQLTCYRHPDRAVGRRCTRCGRPACSECLQQVAVGSHCVECIKAARPDLKTRANHWQAGQRAIVTYTLIAINVGVFVGLGLWYDLGGMFAGSITDAHRLFALNSVFVSGQSFPYPLADGTVVVSNGDEWYRLVTSGFLHFGIIHLAFNMYFLYVLGNLLEPQLGRVKFLLLYIASMLGGSAGVILVDQGSFTAGASGAVFGLLGAAAIGLWQQGINPFSTQIGTLLLINLGLTFFVTGISIGGHLGGLVAGTICGYVMMAPGYRAFPTWSRYATPVVVGIASVAISVVAAA